MLVPRREMRLVANPGFEKGLRGWQPRRLPEVIANHVVDEEMSHSGKASGRIDNSGYYYSPRVNVAPGTRLTARWWAKASGPGANSILYYWRGGQVLRPHRGSGRRRRRMAAVRGRRTRCPRGTEQFCLALQFHGKGSCWYDDVEILSDEAGAASPPAEVRQLAPGVLEIGRRRRAPSGALRRRRGTARGDARRPCLRPARPLGLVCASMAPPSASWRPAALSSAMAWAVPPAP